MDILTDPNLIWIILAAFGLAWMTSRSLGGRLTRPSTWLQSRELTRRSKSAFDDPYDIVRGFTTQVLHDALRRVRRWIAQAARLSEQLPALETRMARFAADRDSAINREEQSTEQSRTAGEAPPYLGTGWTAGLNAMLATGDLFIIATAIQASNRASTQAEAYLTSMALAAALFVMGKSAGDILRRHYEHGAAATVVGSAIVLFTVGLYLLRRDITEAWLVLACAPAIGAAGVAILGASRLQKGAHRAQRDAADAGRRSEAAAKKLGKVRGRIESLVTRANLELVAAGLHSTSIREMAGLEGTVAELERIATEMGITLGDRFYHGAASKGRAAAPAPTDVEIDHGPLATADFSAEPDDATSGNGANSQAAVDPEAAT